jgi:hypothetical protein
LAAAPENCLDDTKQCATSLGLAREFSPKRWLGVYIELSRNIWKNSLRSCHATCKKTPCVASQLHRVVVKHKVLCNISKSSTYERSNTKPSDTEII